LPALFRKRIAGRVEEMEKGRGLGEEGGRASGADWFLQI